MIWLDNYLDLQYYNQPSGFPCYCEPIIQPEDLMLQAQVPMVLGGLYNVKIEVLSGNGIDVYEDATNFFEWYAFQGNNGNYYINFRLRKYSPQMCAHQCFVLRVYVWSTRAIGLEGQTYYIFNKYTERYCVDNCCILPDNITIDVNDGTPQGGEYDPLDYGNEYYNIT